MAFNTIKVSNKTITTTTKILSNKVIFIGSGGGPKRFDSMSPLKKESTRAQILIRGNAHHPL